MADAGGAERLGGRLLGEVEECGLSEVNNPHTNLQHAMN